ncbi:hypothetical protein SPHV1_550020 [Novosphingobium sp. KN65.2]|nr:hypothetical protein SPHV1_550020 [Novosphingobium sp. KN65.2]
MALAVWLISGFRELDFRKSNVSPRLIECAFQLRNLLFEDLNLVWFQLSSGFQSFAIARLALRGCHCHTTCITD